tara:strand:- start:478 stop:1617 length:1140 start_codon:yes stop_codon:yes gene_type:complete
VNLAVKDIRANLARFLLTGLGVGLTLLAAMSMTGLYHGIVSDALAIIDDSGADLWVIQAGTEGPFAEGSSIDRRTLARTLSVPGVRAARQFTLQSRRFEIHGNTVRGSLIGLDFPADRGEWIPLLAGRPLAAGRGEAIADESTGLRLGDELHLDGTRCVVVGLARHYLDSSGNPVVALGINDALDVQTHRPADAVAIARAAGRPVPSGRAANVAAIMLELEDSADVTEVRRTIDRWGDVTVLSAEEQRTVFLYGRLGRLRGQILMFTAVLLLVSAVVIAVTIYTMTLEKQHEIALLKLIGSPNGPIVSMILQQALALGALGYGIAVLLGPLIWPLFPRRLVQPPQDFLMFAAIVLVLCGVGALLGIWKAMQVEAREVLS